VSKPRRRRGAQRVAGERSEGGLEPELAAVRAGAGLFALPERGVAAVRGADRARWLDGMLTNEVEGLAPGGPRSGCHALALTREGRIVAEVHVLARPDALLLELEREALPALLAHLGRFVVADDVVLRDESAAWERFALEGPAAGAVLASALGAVPALHADGVAEATLAGGRVLVAAYSLSGQGGYQLFVPAGAGAAAEASLLAAGATPAGADALEVLRVEGGVPRQGRELTQDALPAEARMERAVSESKGCYTGQEVVTRMRSRGRVSHLLVGLRFASPAAVAPGTELRAGERAVGSVTSAVTSPRFGAIGLGFVRRAEAEAEAALRAGDAEARVAGLPFRDGA
jgi:folate-binding protein YgfZ